MNRKPIIEISPRKEKDLKNIPSGGGNETIFDVDLVEHRLFLKNRLNVASEKLSPWFLKYPDFPQVIKITIRGDAIAKCHRPKDFLRNMNVLTYGLPTEIFVAVTQDKLKEAIIDCDLRETIKYKANISTILDIQGFLPEDKKINIDNSEVHDIVVKTFEYDTENNEKAESQISMLVNELNIEQKIIKVGDKICLRVFKNINNKIINIIKTLPCVLSIREVASLCSLNTSSNKVENFIPQRNYNTIDNVIIAVVDTGISEEAIDSKYIYARETYIPKEYQNNSHGTFVASTILFGNEINDRDEINPVIFRLLDVIVLTSKDKGIELKDDEFCEILYEVVKKYHDKVKIWNLSIGFETVIAKDDAISDIGAYCDELQKKYDVQFVISSGNYANLPVREWPVSIGSNADRIISPADSIKAITVGSLAEKDAPGSKSKKGEPSPFSRRGPGACSLFKPELTDFGGNMFLDFSFNNIGVSGLDTKGNKNENIGTSFSAPLVSYKFGKIYSSLENKDLLLAKTLLIHDALRNTPTILNCENNYRKYYGFGRPSNDCEYILECNETDITLVLRCELVTGTMVDIKDFPYPKSMINNGKCTGEIFATLVSEPYFNKKYGSEYSRIDFELSIGTIGYDDTKNKDVYSRQVYPLKPEKSKYKFEEDLVEEDLKWNPIKTYHRKFNSGTDLKDGWRISVQLHSRFGEPNSEHICYVAITFVGDVDTVYDEMVEEIKNRGFEMDEISISSQVRNPLNDND